MKCFSHRNSDAVAVCRSCGRALCSDCIAEVGLSCACINRCEADVAKFNEMLTRGRPEPVNPANLFGYDRVIFLMALGVGFVCFGLYGLCHSGDRHLNLFLAVFGVAFSIFGISQFFTTKKFRKQFRDKKD